MDAGKLSHMLSASWLAVANSTNSSAGMPTIIAASQSSTAALTIGMTLGALLLGPLVVCACWQRCRCYEAFEAEFHGNVGAFVYTLFVHDLNKH